MATQQASRDRSVNRKLIIKGRGAAAVTFPAQIELLTTLLNDTYSPRWVLNKTQLPLKRCVYNIYPHGDSSTNLTTFTMYDLHYLMYTSVLTGMFTRPARLHDEPRK